MKKKTVVAGHICLDITPIFPQLPFDKMSDILLPGKIVQMEGVDVSTGGAVANTGLAMKILGADVRLIGKVGEDEFGDLICSILSKYDAADGMIREKNQDTSYSVVLALPGIDRIFLHCPGANNTYTADDISPEYIEDASLFHFGYPPLMKKMYVDDGYELIRLFKKVKAFGCATSLDMAAVDSKSDAADVDWGSIVERVLPYVDFFVPSIEELCFMIDKPRYMSWQDRAKDRDIAEILDFKNDIKPVADYCMDIGCKILLLKCGVKGMYLRTAGDDVLSSISKRINLDINKWADKDILEKPYRPDRILSATGAGDTGIAAFLTSVIEGYSPEESLHLASAASASCLTSYDALSGLMNLDELRNKINNGWNKLGE